MNHNMLISKRITSNKVYLQLKKILSNKLLCRRIFKSVLHSTLALIFCLIPKVRSRLGGSAVMLPLVSVACGPGKRFGTMMEGVIFYISGLLIGNAWALLGRFIAQRILGNELLKHTDAELYHLNYNRYEQALVVLAIFEMISLFLQGYMRSLSYKLFNFVFPMFLVIHFSFMTALNVSSGEIAKTYTTPFMFGIAMAILINVLVFPETGSSYLGNSTLNAFNQMDITILNVLDFFMDGGTYTTKESRTRLSTLLKNKSDWASKLSLTNTAFKECSFEISYSYLSPFDLEKLLANLDKISTNISALINTCQLEFALLHSKGKKYTVNEHDESVSFVSKDDDLLLVHLLIALKEVLTESSGAIFENLVLIKFLISYSYDVDQKCIDPTLSKLEELYRSNSLSESFRNDLMKFGIDIANITDFKIKNLKIGQIDDEFFEKHLNDLLLTMVKSETSLKEKISETYVSINETLLPSDEIFLLSSFLINLKEFLNNLVSIMKQVKLINNKRKKRESVGAFRGKRIWFFKFNKLPHFFSMNGKSINGEDASLLGNSAVMHTTVEADNFSLANDPVEYQNKKSLVKELDEVDAILPISIQPIHKIESLKKRISNLRDRLLIKLYKHTTKNKLHIRFGFQLTIALMVASLPMFIPKSRQWYIDIRGSWVGFVCTLSLEPSIGATFFVAFLRLIGVIIGSSWGLLSYVSADHQSNRYVEVIITVIGAVPGFYFLLGTPYVKAALIGVVSVYVVMLASIIPSDIGGSIVLNFGKRCLAMLYGGTVALLVQICVLPLRARDRLVDEVAFAISSCGQMELLLATGLEGEEVKTAMADEKYEKFISLSKSAMGALSRATTYKLEARREFRLKGNFEEIEKIFTEILFILHQIIERMDNIVLLRRQYGSAIIEELNSEVYPYRRQLVGSISSVLRTLSEALLNKTPLPHFLPSPRIAHRRLIERVREILGSRREISKISKQKRFTLNTDSGSESGSESESGSNFEEKSSHLDSSGHILNQNFISWSASSSATEEVIDFIEELIELIQLLVGVNEFKYGFLARSLYEDWAAKAITGFDSTTNIDEKLETVREPMNDSDNESLDSLQNPDEINPVGITSEFGMASLEPTFSMGSRLSENFRRRVNSFGMKAHNQDGHRRISLGGNIDSADDLPLSLRKQVSKRSERPGFGNYND